MTYIHGRPTRTASACPWLSPAFKGNQKGSEEWASWKPKLSMSFSVENVSEGP